MSSCIPALEARLPQMNVTDHLSPLLKYCQLGIVHHQRMSDYSSYSQRTGLASSLVKLTMVRAVLPAPDLNYLALMCLSFLTGPCR